MSESIIPPVTNNGAKGQFEIRTDSDLATLKYRRQGSTLDLVHTEVPPAYGGMGYGTALVKAALTFARDEKLKIIPTCPFVKRYVERHPEAASLVATSRTDR
jgi:predicted GNAT family acetyltransferase